MNDAIEHSLATWRKWHDRGYFPRMAQHKDWRVYDEIEPCFLVPMAPTEHDDALEIGCGYGQRMIPLARLVSLVRGFDVSESLMLKAYEKFREHGVADRCMMIVGDGRSIPFPDASFSLVYSISVFQHMPRALVALYMRETARVLRPGGRALFHFRNANTAAGPVSRDIVAGQTSGWSVGWTVDEAVVAANISGLETYYTWTDSPDSIVTMARRRGD
ncbi:MAG TPA: class I SAM-dependent methyltransferase [Planctomycetota bacterium]|nr:class I SAM-dependent methyltransferase [Planctomycetota bacterium]